LEDSLRLESTMTQKQKNCQMFAQNLGKEMAVAKRFPKIWARNWQLPNGSPESGQGIGSCQMVPRNMGKELAVAKWFPKIWAKKWQLPNGSPESGQRNGSCQMVPQNPGKELAVYYDIKRS